MTPRSRPSSRPRPRSSAHSVRLVRSGSVMAAAPWLLLGLLRAACVLTSPPATAPRRGVPPSVRPPATPIRNLSLDPAQRRLSWDVVGDDVIAAGSRFLCQKGRGGPLWVSGRGREPVSHPRLAPPTHRPLPLPAPRPSTHPAHFWPCSFCNFRPPHPLLAPSPDPRPTPGGGAAPSRRSPAVT